MCNSQDHSSARLLAGSAKTDAEILAARGTKNRVDPYQPYGFFVEPECSAEGTIESVATLLLTNRECPLRCLMCDLWQNTTDTRVSLGAIPAQIDFALARLPAATQIKLYNSGNFFDRQAIPAEDFAEIAARVRGFQRVIVENHPRFCGDACREFRDLVQGRLEIAIGLETVHPEVLERLNKRMTVDDFVRAAAGLRADQIFVRAFILLRPPYLTEDEGLEWALRSVDVAFEAGAECCTIIPTRAGNGIMEQLRQVGLFEPPRLETLESAVEHCLRAGRRRVFADLWNVELLQACPQCGARRRERLLRMNLTQQVLPPVHCDACGK